MSESSELMRLAQENHYLKKEIRANKETIVNLKNALERVRDFPNVGKSVQQVAREALK